MEPPYYYDDEAYHCDPVELETFARDLFMERFSAEAFDPSDVIGCNPAVVIPDDVLIPDPRDRLDDAQMQLVVTRQGSVRQEGFCMLCVYDTNVSYTDRMKPYGGSSDAIENWVKHACNHLREVLDHVEQYQHILWNRETRARRHRTAEGGSDARLGTSKKRSAKGKLQQEPKRSRRQAEQAEAHSSRRKGAKGKGKAKAINSGSDDDYEYGTTDAEDTESDDESEDESDDESEGESDDESEDESDGECEERVSILGHPLRLRNGTAPFVFHNDEFSCPHPVCRSNKRTHGTMLDFVQHLVAAHNFPVVRSTGNKARLPTLADLSFANEEELNLFRSYTGPKRSDGGRGNGPARRFSRLPGPCQ